MLNRKTETVRTFINTGFSSLDGGKTDVIAEALDAEHPDSRIRPPHLFDEADPASIFDPGPTIAVDATWGEKHSVVFDDKVILNRIWSIGNRMGLDANQLPWPRTTRSLSVGDVVQLRGTYYAVQVAGWTELGEPPQVLTAAWGEYDADIRRDGATDWRI